MLQCLPRRGQLIESCPAGVGPIAEQEGHIPEPAGGDLLADAWYRSQRTTTRPERFGSVFYSYIQCYILYNMSNFQHFIHFLCLKESSCSCVY